jgi:hypothetical protein
LQAGDELVDSDLLAFFVGEDMAIGFGWGFVQFDRFRDFDKVLDDVAVVEF